MDLNEVLRQPEGFTPPDVTVKIKKVWDYKHGEGENGPWSFQNVEVEGGGRLKLKGLPQFPKEREGQTVTLRANQSKQHGLTGLKVNHDQYNGKNIDQLVITNSCKWEFAQNATNGSNQTRASATAAYSSPLSVEDYISHLLGVAALTDQITKKLEITDESAIQACFATLCIDTKNRGVMLRQNLPVAQPSASQPGEQSDPYEDAPLPDDGQGIEDDDIPF